MKMGFFKNLFRKKEYRTVETVEVDEHLRQIMGLVTNAISLNVAATKKALFRLMNVLHKKSLTTSKKNGKLSILPTTQT